MVRRSESATQNANNIRVNDNVCGTTETNWTVDVYGKAVRQESIAGRGKVTQYPRAPGIKHNIEKLRRAQQIANILGKSSLVRFL